MSVLSSLPLTGPAYVAPAVYLDRERERRRQRGIARKLFDGKWREVFLVLGKTQFVFRELQRHDGGIEAFFQTFNLFGRAMTTFADFIANRPAVVDVPESFPEQRQAIARIREACLFDALLHEASLITRLEGRAVLLPDLDAASGSAVLCLLDNDQIFPAGPDGKDRQPTVWERRWIIERADPASKTKKLRYLRVERHRVVAGRGVVEQEAYKVESCETLVDLARQKRVPLAEAVGDGPAPEEVSYTGLTRPLPVQLVNYMVRGEPQMTVTDAELDMMDAATKQLSDISRAMAIHGSPKMRITDSLIDKKTGKAKISLECFDDPEKVVEYISVEFSFDAMMTFLSRLQQYVLVQLEISQALLGIRLDGGATPDTVDKLRLESTGTVAAVQRTEAYFTLALKRAWTDACTLDARRPLGAPGSAGYAVEPVDVQLRTGLPQDVLDIAREQRELLEAGLTSQRRALWEIHGEAKAAAILAEIDQDRSAAAARQREALYGAGFNDPTGPAPGINNPDADAPASTPAPEGAAA